MVVCVVGRWGFSVRKVLAYVSGISEKLTFLTDQNGILGQNNQLVHVANPDLINTMIADGIISGGMYTKVMTMMTAIMSGISEVRVLNASTASSLLNDDKIGTLLVNNQINAEKEMTEWNR